MSSFSNLFQTARNAIVAKGSVFVKAAEADALELEAKARIVALDAINTAKNDLAAFYEKEAARVHADADVVKARFNAILALL